MARLAVIGAGWAGLAAAVQATAQGHAVSVLEMAPVPGGRARTVVHGDESLDNGQHILIGAYAATLALMRQVGVDPERVLHRQPLALVDPQGRGLVLRPGPAHWAFLRALGMHPNWSWADRLSLLRSGLAWLLSRFQAAPTATVKQLCRNLSPTVYRDLVEPLCVAALNTPASEASAQVFLTVLRDGLFGTRGCADLLLPRRPLGELLPQPAWAWLASRGAALRARTRVAELVRTGDDGWLVCGERHDGVILACSAQEAARLAEPHAPAWAARLQSIRHEPIATVVLDSPGARLAGAMVSLPEGPAQFAFDQGALGARPGRFTFVVSGAAPWLEDGSASLVQAVLAQARTAFPAGTWPAQPTLRACFTERRATFRCVAGLERPAPIVAPGLVAAGDYVQGPYPATLEGAVRSGLWAAGHFR
jgi:squalene-associated FAD-dependent desaturase